MLVSAIFVAITTYKYDKTYFKIYKDKQKSFKFIEYKKILYIFFLFFERENIIYLVL